MHNEHAPIDHLLCNYSTSLPCNSLANLFKVPGNRLFSSHVKSESCFWNYVAVCLSTHGISGTSELHWLKYPIRLSSLYVEIQKYFLVSEALFLYSSQNVSIPIDIRRNSSLHINCTMCIICERTSMWKYSGWMKTTVFGIVCISYDRNDHHHN